MDVSHRNISYESYRNEDQDCSFLVVDAAHAVPDRGAFARDACGEEAATGVLFLALEDSYAEPRVVTTLVDADGVVEPATPHAAACAARWAVERLEDTTVLLDTQTGTYRAVVDGGDVRVEALAPDIDDATVRVRRASTEDARLASPAPATDGGRPGHDGHPGTETVAPDEPNRADDD
jgi:diaminopimelate epimerase